MMTAGMGERGVGEARTKVRGLLTKTGLRG